MKKLLRPFEALIQRRLPARLRNGDPDEARRARVILGVSLVLCIQVALNMPMILYLRAWAVAVLSMTVVVQYVALPRVLARSTSLGTHYLLTQMLVVTDGVVYYGGGAEGTSLFWTISQPILAALCGGPRAGMVWFGIVSANAVAWAALSPRLHLHNLMVAPSQVAAANSFGVVALGVEILAFALLYERHSAQMLQAVRGAGESMRRVLDNVGQGFLIVDARGGLRGDPSAITASWFGERHDEEPVWSWISRTDAHGASWLEAGWDAVFEDFLPPEVTLAQMPTQLVRGEQTLGLEYRPLRNKEGALNALVIIISDVTAAVEAEKAERAQREQASLFERLAHDRRGFLLFWDEAEHILRQLREGAPHKARLLHTLKGNAGLHGLQSVALACHAAEGSLEEHGGVLPEADLQSVERAWEQSTHRIARQLHEERERIEVRRDEFDTLEAAIQRRLEHARLGQMVSAWRYERTQATFARLAEQAISLAERLGKGPIEVLIQDGGVRLDPGVWAPVWGAMVHAIRNALDHGIEDRETRVARGKSPMALLRFSSRYEGDEVVIELADDGGGIDWERVAEKCRARGMPSGTHDDLVRALFADGFSTRDEVTEVSGRGVGFAAFAASVRDLGGRIELDSTPGEGTCVRLRAPRAEALALAS